MAIKLWRNHTIWLWSLSPVAVAVVLVLLLAEFELIEFHFSIHDMDTFILFTGLLVTVLVSFVLLSRRVMRHIESRSDRSLRSAFAEDRIRFLRRLDHEIKNPLMGIQTALDNLSQEQDSAKRSAIRAAISDQIERLSRLVSDLRRIGDMEHHEIERLPVHTITLLQEALQMLKDDEDAAHRQIDSDITQGLPQIVGDYDLLLLALHNVLINAVKYTHDGDQIRLTARKDDACVQIAVTDTGPGIPPQDLPYVMDELFRSQQVKDIAGSGVGLSLVRRIVERHQGRVSITSQVGKGTTVILCLPHSGPAS